MPFLRTLSGHDTSSNPDGSPLEGLAHELAAQASSGTGPQSLCQAYTAERTAAIRAALPHVAATTTAAFGARPGTATETCEYRA